MRLFIAEKPSVARAIAAELGVEQSGKGWIRCRSGDTVTWCFGHLLQMAPPEHYDETYARWRAEDLPIVPARWALLPREKAAQQLAVIGRLLNTAHEVVNAGDPDREGQLLVDEVLEHFGNQCPVRRFWVLAQDPVSIQRGLAALRDNADYRGLSAAALARQRADWLVGMNFSRAYTLRAQRGGAQRLVLPVGRVQTPTLALVVQRDREIEAFEPRAFHTLHATVAHASGTFQATWQPAEGQPGLDAHGRLTDPQVADAVIRACLGQAGEVLEYRREPRAQRQPCVYSLSNLTLKASSRYGHGAEHVLKACQALYETHRLTSYPRTDCDYLPESQHADAPRVLAALRQVNPQLAELIDRADPAIRSKTFDDAKVTAHHGIIPTMHAGDVSRLSETERHVYELIVRAYLAQFYPPHEYLATTVTVAVAGHRFTASGRTVTRNGWRDVYQVEADDSKEAQASDEQALPAMAVGDTVQCVGVERRDRQTTPAQRFSEGTLQKAMENIHQFVTDPQEKQLLRAGDGIGTAATRAAIIGELKRRGLIAPQGRQIVSTPLGRGLIDALPAEVRSPSLTARYDRMLSEIEQGQATVDAFLQTQIEFVRGQVAAANQGAASLPGASGPRCPKCGEGFLRLISRKDGQGKFWGCSRYREGCLATFDDAHGKPDLGARKGGQRKRPKRGS